MGWYYEERPSGQTVAEFFEKKVTFERNGHTSRMLDCAVVSLNTAYIAIETTSPKTEKPKVYALVCQLHHVPNDYYNLGYKDVDEDMGPIEYDCPERILKFLTPPATDNAEHWRKVCWESIENRKNAPPLKSGKYLVLDTPLKFANGDEISTFYIKNAKRRIFLESRSGYQSYKLPNNSKLRDVGFDIVDDPSEAGNPQKPKATRQEEPGQIDTPLFSLK